MKKIEIEQYEKHFEALSKWNECRAADEKRALEKFYSLKEAFKNQKINEHEINFRKNN